MVSRRTNAVGSSHNEPAVSRGIGAAGETERRGEEQLDHVWRANSTIVTGAQPDVADRSELGCDLIRVRAEVVIRDLVIGITIAASDREVLDERVADDRHLHFG